MSRSKNVGEVNQTTGEKVTKPQLSFRVSKNFASQLDNFADERNWDRTSAVRFAIAKAIGLEYEPSAQEQVDNDFVQISVQVEPAWYDAIKEEAKRADTGIAQFARSKVASTVAYDLASEPEPKRGGAGSKVRSVKMSLEKVLAVLELFNPEMAVELRANSAKLEEMAKALGS